MIHFERPPWGYSKIYFSYINNKTDLFDSLGLVTSKLQAKDQPHWPHRIFEHRYNVPWWFFVCFRWQGRQGYALGFEWWQTFVYLGSCRYHQQPCLLSKQILALCRNRTKHQNLGLGKQKHGRRATTRGRWPQHSCWSTSVPVNGMVVRWANIVCWLFW